MESSVLPARTEGSGESKPPAARGGRQPPATGHGPDCVIDQGADAPRAPRFSEPPFENRTSAEPPTRHPPGPGPPTLTTHSSPPPPPPGSSTTPARLPPSPSC